MHAPTALTLLAALMFTPQGWAQTMPSFVLVDTQEAAYTVFAAVPSEKPQGVDTGRAGIEIVTWARFSADIEKLLAERVRKNEYPDWRVADGLMALLKEYPGTPIGLTWNGGIAFTYQDYEHSNKTYMTYTSNPDEYERNRPADPAGDPVHPSNHFGALLGEDYRKTP
jgi:hypothetical protein